MEHDCKEVLEEVYEFLDGECTPEKKAHIRQHLEDCPPCFEAFDFEAEVKQFVRSKCQETSPDDLKARIADAIERESSQ